MSSTTISNNPAIINNSTLFLLLVISSSFFNYSCSSRTKLMALNCNCSAQFSIQKYGSSLKYAKKELVSKRSSVPQKKAPIGPAVLRITASIKNKVYEDESQGIICYEDESGEIICEGYDEGPRYQRISTPTHHPRDAEIMNLLQQQNCLKILKGEEINNHEVEGQEDLNFKKGL